MFVFGWFYENNFTDKEITEDNLRKFPLFKNVFYLVTDTLEKVGEFVGFTSFMWWILGLPTYISRSPIRKEC